MIISLQDISKRFNYDWIFRNVNHTFESGNRYAITGPNGSGKSTLLRIIAGQLQPTTGKVNFKEDIALSDENIFRHISFAAPYLELIEEYTLEELFHFQERFRNWRNAMDHRSLLELSGLEKHRKKEIRQFSSGMRQRVKLILAICSDTSILILDEPGTNLDNASFVWYQNLLDRFAENRIIILGSNLEREFADCGQVIEMNDFK